MGLVDLIGASRIFDSRHACVAAYNLNYAQVEARAGICASALISTSPSTGPILI